MTEQEVRKYLRQMKEESSERAFKGFFDLTYDRLFRIAYYYLKHEEWAQEVVLDVFLALWKQRDTLASVQNIEDYCFVLTRNASLNYLEKEVRRSDSLSAELTENDASSAKSSLPATSRRWTACPNAAAKSSSASAKRSRAMPRWPKSWASASRP